METQNKRQAVKRHHHKHNLKHRYEFIHTLGNGTYGKVKKAVERSGRMVAIKSIRKEKIKDEQDLIHIRREIEIMSSLNHPHIISIYEVFENKDKIVIVMEFASGGDLFDYISEKQISEKQARHFFRQIISAVHYCHQNGIVHRDLKLENILLDENGDVKIADFGLSNLYCGEEYLQTYCGSPLYASPEMVNGRPYRGPEVDSWSLGVLLYTLVHGAMPFNSHDYRSLVRQISTGDYHKPSKPSDACGLIRWMLMVNPERRATVEEIAAHWWLNWGYQRPLLAEGETSASPGTLQSSAPPAGGSTHLSASPGALQSAAPPAGGSTRIADWLRRTTLPFLQTNSKMRCLLRSGGGAGGEVTTVTRQCSIRRSRKENNVSQSLQESHGHSHVHTHVHAPRPYKGILKKRNSLKQKQTNEAPPLEEKSTNEILAPPTAPPPAPPPRKGILKKPGSERESGYYSSSPDSSDSATQRSSTPPKRKGILKRHNRSSLNQFGSFDQLVASSPQGGVTTRPSGAVSEDSLLSSESFDRLDLPDRHERDTAKLERPAGGAGCMRGSVSADNLLDLKGTSQHQGYWDAARYGGSTFSITDCENVTEVYKRALSNVCTS